MQLDKNAAVARGCGVNSYRFVITWFGLLVRYPQRADKALLGATWNLTRRLP